MCVCVCVFSSSYKTLTVTLFARKCRTEVKTFSDKTSM